MSKEDLMNELGAKSASNGMMGGPGSGRKPGNGAMTGKIPNPSDEDIAKMNKHFKDQIAPKNEKVPNWGESKLVKQQIEEKAKIVSDKALAHREFKKLEKEKGRDHPDTQTALQKYVDLPKLSDYKSKVI